MAVIKKGGVGKKSAVLRFKHMYVIGKVVLECRVEG